MGAQPPGYIPNPNGPGYIPDPNRNTPPTNNGTGGQDGTSSSGGGMGAGIGIGALLSQMMGQRSGSIVKPRSAMATYGQPTGGVFGQQAQGPAPMPTAGGPAAGGGEGFLGAAREQALSDFMKQGGLESLSRRLPGVRF